MEDELNEAVHYLENQKFGNQESQHANQDLEVEDVYGDIDDFDLGTLIEKGHEKNRLLEENNERLQADNEKLLSAIQVLTCEQNNLKKNISSLYLTARTEIDRKDKVIVELRTELEDLKFRRVGKRKRNYDSNDHSGQKIPKFVQTSQAQDQSESDMYKIEKPNMTRVEEIKSFSESCQDNNKKERTCERYDEKVNDRRSKHEDDVDIGNHHYRNRYSEAGFHRRRETNSEYQNNNRIEKTESCPGGRSFKLDLERNKGDQNQTDKYQIETDRCRSRTRDRQLVRDHPRSRSSGRNALEENRKYDGSNRTREHSDRVRYNSSTNFEDDRNRKDSDTYYNKYDDRFRDGNHLPNRGYRHDKFRNRRSSQERQSHIRDSRYHPTYSNRRDRDYDKGKRFSSSDRSYDRFMNFNRRQEDRQNHFSKNGPLELRQRTKSESVDAKEELNDEEHIENAICLNLPEEVINQELSASKKIEYTRISLAQYKEKKQIAMVGGDGIQKMEEERMEQQLSEIDMKPAIESQTTNDDEDKSVGMSQLTATSEDSEQKGLIKKQRKKLKFVTELENKILKTPIKKYPKERNSKSTDKNDNNKIKLTSRCDNIPFGVNEIEVNNKISCTVFTGVDPPGEVSGSSLKDENKEIANIKSRVSSVESVKKKCSTNFTEHLNELQQDIFKKLNKKVKTSSSNNSGDSETEEVLCKSYAKEVSQIFSISEKGIVNDVEKFVNDVVQDKITRKCVDNPGQNIAKISNNSEKVPQQMDLDSQITNVDVGKDGNNTNEAVLMVNENIPGVDKKENLDKLGKQNEDSIALSPPETMVDISLEVASILKHHAITGQHMNNHNLNSQLSCIHTEIESSQNDTELTLKPIVQKSCNESEQLKNVSKDKFKENKRLNISESSKEISLDSVTKEKEFFTNTQHSNRAEALNSLSEMNKENSLNKMNKKSKHPQENKFETNNIQRKTSNHKKTTVSCVSLPCKRPGRSSSVSTARYLFGTDDESSDDDEILNVKDINRTKLICKDVGAETADPNSEKTNIEDPTEIIYDKSVDCRSNNDGLKNYKIPKKTHLPLNQSENMSILEEQKNNARKLEPKHVKLNEELVIEDLHDKRTSNHQNNKVGDKHKRNSGRSEKLMEKNILQKKQDMISFGVKFEKSKEIRNENHQEDNLKKSQNLSTNYKTSSLVSTKRKCIDTKIDTNRQDEKNEKFNKKVRTETELKKSHIENNELHSNSMKDDQARYNTVKKEESKYSVPSNMSIYSTTDAIKDILKDTCKILKINSTEEEKAEYEPSKKESSNPEVISHQNNGNILPINEPQQRFTNVSPIKKTALQNSLNKIVLHSDVRLTPVNSIEFTPQNSFDSCQKSIEWIVTKLGEEERLSICENGANEINRKTPEHINKELLENNSSPACQIMKKGTQSQLLNTDISPSEIITENKKPRRRYTNKKPTPETKELRRSQRIVKNNELVKGKSNEVLKKKNEVKIEKGNDESSSISSSAPICSFENILEQNNVISFQKDIHLQNSLHLTHEGEIPVLTLDENHFSHLPNDVYKNPDKNIIKLLDSMNISNMECDIMKNTEDPVHKIEKTNSIVVESSNESLTFENFLGKVSSTPLIAKNVTHDPCLSKTSNMIVSENKKEENVDRSSLVILNIMDPSHTTPPVLEATKCSEIIGCAKNETYFDDEGQKKSSIEVNNVVSTINGSRSNNCGDNTNEKNGISLRSTEMNSSSMTIDTVHISKISNNPRTNNSGQCVANTSVARPTGMTVTSRRRRCRIVRIA